MSDQPYITLILPAYNEVRRIANTISEAKAYFEKSGYTHEIIVSADGDDGTRELVTKMGQTDPALKVIGGVERRGKGYGIRRAVAMAQGQIIGFSDADNKTPIDEFDKVAPLLQQGVDVVIGSRGARESQIERRQPLYRQVGSRGFGVFMHTVIGLHDIKDTQCGFKFFQRHVATDIFSRQQIDAYMYDVEILYLAKQAGYQIAQVPIRWRDDGDSRLELVRGNIQNLKDIFRIRLTALRAPRPVTVKHEAKS